MQPEYKIFRGIRNITVERERITILLILLTLTMVLNPCSHLEHTTRSIIQSASRVTFGLPMEHNVKIKDMVNSFFLQKRDTFSF